jgi:cation transport ATPase
MVASGELVTVDGVMTTDSAVFDESALTGEPQPIERTAGDPVRSGVVNAGAPLDLRATSGAADSTYPGLVRLVTEAESPWPHQPASNRPRVPGSPAAGVRAR